MMKSLSFLVSSSLLMMLWSPVAGAQIQSRKQAIALAAAAAMEQGEPVELGEDVQVRGLRNLSSQSVVVIFLSAHSDDCFVSVEMDKKTEKFLSIDVRCN